MKPSDGLDAIEARAEELKPIARDSYFQFQRFLVSKKFDPTKLLENAKKVPGEDGNVHWEAIFSATSDMRIEVRNEERVQGARPAVVPILPTAAVEIDELLDEVPAAIASTEEARRQQQAVDDSQAAILDEFFAATGGKGLIYGSWLETDGGLEKGGGGRGGDRRGSVRRDRGRRRVRDGRCPPEQRPQRHHPAVLRPAGAAPVGGLFGNEKRC